MSAWKQFYPRPSGEGVFAVPQIKYFPDFSTIDVNEHYRALFLSAAVEEDKAKVVAGFFGHTSPDEWPIADWAFDAMRQWQLEVVGRKIALRSPENSPDEPEYDPAKCMTIALSGMRHGESAKEVLAFRRRQAVRQGVLNGEASFSLRDYYLVHELVVETRKFRRDLSRTASVLSEEERDGIVAQVTLEGVSPSVALESHGISSTARVSNRSLGWVRSLFESGPQRPHSARFDSEQEMLKRVLKDPRIDRVSIKICSWCLGVGQEYARRAISPSSVQHAGPGGQAQGDSIRRPRFRGTSSWRFRTGARRQRRNLRGRPRRFSK